MQSNMSRQAVRDLISPAHPPHSQSFTSRSSWMATAAGRRGGDCRASPVIARGSARRARVVEAAPGLGATMLTLYAFSSDNWRRPAPPK